MKLKITGGYIDCEEVIDPTPVPPPPIPNDVYLKWLNNMVTYGEKLGQFLMDGSQKPDPLLAATYYDAAWVFFQIAEFRGETGWFKYADRALEIYRDAYLIPNNFAAPGYWLFPHGLAEDWIRNKNQKSKDALINLRTLGLWVRDSTPLAWMDSFELSREVAYSIETYIQVERITGQKAPRIDEYIKRAFGHLDQWFVQKTASYLRPFMPALTMKALISAKAMSGKTFAVALDYLWDNFWIPEKKCFKYGSNATPPDTDPAPDLNLLIAPIYEWQYQQTKELRFRTRGDQLFAGGVDGAWLANGKQFNQNYRLSFEYVQMRTK